MPNVGEAVVSLQARTADFRRALQESSNYIKQLRADLNSGRITAQQFGESMSAVRDRMLSFRSATSALSGKELSQFNSVLVATAPAAERAGATLRSLRSPLSVLAAQAIGTSGSVGALGSALLAISGGTGLAIGAVAGIGAIAYAVNLVGQEADTAETEYNQLIDTLTKKSPLAILGAQMDALTERLKAPQFGAYTKILDFFRGLVGLKDVRTDTILRLSEVTERYFNTYKDTQTASHETAASRDKETHRTYQLRDAMEVLNSTLAHQLELYKNRNNLLTISSVLGTKKETPFAVDTEAIGRGVEQSLQGVDLIPDALKRIQAWREVGLRIGDVVGKGLAAGITSAIFDKQKSIGDILKGIFRQIFEEILNEVVKGFAKKIGASIAAALAKNAIAGGGIFGAIGGVVSGFLGGIFSRASEPTNTSIVVPVSAIPPNPSPIAMARDSQHLALWAETERVARSMGVRISLR